MIGKPWYTSKTLWVNAIGLALGIAVAVGLSDTQVAMYTGIVLPILNVILRAVTGEPITISSQDVGV